ncbi:uncharacterized protein LOC144352827 [Saccoglossus kowalevskii]
MAYSILVMLLIIEVLLSSFIESEANENDISPHTADCGTDDATYPNECLLCQAADRKKCKGEQDLLIKHGGWCDAAIIYIDSPDHENGSGSLNDIVYPGRPQWCLNKINNVDTNQNVIE